MIWFFGLFWLQGWLLTAVQEGQLCFILLEFSVQLHLFKQEKHGIIAESLAHHTWPEGTLWLIGVDQITLAFWTQHYRDLQQWRLLHLMSPRPLLCKFTIFITGWSGTYMYMFRTTVVYFGVTKNMTSVLQIRINFMYTVHVCACICIVVDMLWFCVGLKNNWRWNMTVH